jgi:hypothetical protein
MGDYHLPRPHAARVHRDGFRDDVTSSAATAGSTKERPGIVQLPGPVQENEATPMSQPKVLRAHDVLPPVFPDDDPAVLTIPEVARELRCSKTHLHNIIYGKVPGLPPLPVLRIGRRVLIRHDGLKAWILSVEAREIEAQKLTGLFRKGAEQCYDPIT